MSLFKLMVAKSSRIDMGNACSDICESYPACDLRNDNVNGFSLVSRENISRTEEQEKVALSAAALGNKEEYSRELCTIVCFVGQSHFFVTIDYI
ncbi:MAG: hypothetical protein MJ025_05950, partial [Victivallaceae bacterium]|nr:hypothetical protein [Victivallaceae bacterium]